MFMENQYQTYFLTIICDSFDLTPKDIERGIGSTDYVQSVQRSVGETGIYNFFVSGKHGLRRKDFLEHFKELSRSLKDFPQLSRRNVHLSRVRSD